MSELRKTPTAPPVYRPEQKKSVQPKMAAASETPKTPKAPAVYRPQPTPKVLQAKESQTRANASGQRRSSAPRGGPQSQGRNVIQALFYEKTPEGEYIWHTGPVFSRWWQATSETYNGGWGVWLRKSAMKTVTATIPKKPEKTVETSKAEVPKQNTSPVVSHSTSSSSSSSPTPTTTTATTPTTTTTSTTSTSSLSSSSEERAAKQVYSAEAAISHILSARFLSEPSLSTIEAELKENFAGVPAAKKLHFILDAYRQKQKPSPLVSASASSSSSSSTATTTTTTTTTTAAPTFSGTDSEIIERAYSEYQRTKKKPIKTGVTVTDGMGKREYTTGDFGSVFNHGEQLALDKEIGKQGSVIHLIQNAWPCDKCYKRFTERVDLRGKTVIINVIDDHGMYSTVNDLPRGSIGQMIIDNNTISYDNLAIIN